MKPDILEDLLHQELRSLYSAEKQMFKALTKMAQVACHPKVRAVFNARLEESGAQVRRLERIAAHMGKGLEGTKCLGMKQLVEDEARESLLNADTRTKTYDAGLISSLRHFIGYEIERYELATMLASRLGLDEVERLIRWNLNDQKTLATRLNRLAKSLMKGRTKNITTSTFAAPAFQEALMASLRFLRGSGCGPTVLTSPS
jgi:ferritin-like metal-binding protein YciE